MVQGARWHSPERSMSGILNRHGQLFYRMERWERDKHQCAHCYEKATYLHAHSGSYYCTAHMGRIER